MAPVSEATEVFRAARDQLLGWYGDHEAAVAGFRYPELTGPFNWVSDWFDEIADGNDRRGLVVVEEDGSQHVAHVRRAARAVAGRVGVAGPPGRPEGRLGHRDARQPGRAVGVDAGDHAARRRGDADDDGGRPGRARRPDRARRRPARDRRLPGRRQVRRRTRRLHADLRRPGRGLALLRRRVRRRRRPRVEHAGTTPEDRLLLYFTSGTTSRPKLVEHTQVSYPVGHLSTMFWLGVRPGDVHLNISSAGWAKHAWSCFFAPWIAEATIVVLNYGRFDPQTLLAQLREQEVTTFCAPPTVWRMLIKSDLCGGAGSLRELIGAGEPLNPEVIAQVQDKWGMTLRDGYGQTEMTAAVGNTPGSVVKPGSMGRPLPGVPVVLVDPATGERVDGAGEGEICLDLEGPTGPPAAADDGLPGRPGARRRGDGRRLLPHRRPGGPRRGRLHHLRRPHRRRVQGQRLQDQPVRARVGAHRARRGRGGRDRARPGRGAAGGAEGVRRPGGRPRGERARRRWTS